MTGKACELCNFFVVLRDDLPFVHGRCRRFPPAVPLVRGQGSGWAWVQANDWCGEFKQKEEEES